MTTLTIDEIDALANLIDATREWNESMPAALPPHRQSRLAMTVSQYVRGRLELSGLPAEGRRYADAR